MGDKRIPLTDRDYYLEDEMAPMLGLSVSTLQKNRSIGRKHPPFQKVGRDVRYPKKLANEYLRNIPVIHEVGYERNTG
jgi:hypothetical protein